MWGCWSPRTDGEPVQHMTGADPVTPLRTFLSSWVLVSAMALLHLVHDQLEADAGHSIFPYGKKKNPAVRNTRWHLGHLKLLRDTGARPPCSWAALL